MIGGVVAVIGGTCGPRLSGPKYFSTSAFVCGLVEIADDGQAGVVRRVVLLEETLHVVELGRLDVGVRADHVGVVRVARRKQQLHDGLVDHAVRAVLDALAALVAHDVLLVGELGCVELVEQIAHAIGLEPQRQLELIRRAASRNSSCDRNRSCR